MTLIKKSLVYLLLVGFGAASFAQENTEAVTSTTSDSEVKIGAKIGYSLGNLSSRSENIYTEDFESITGIDFGLVFEFKLSELISMQTELNYTQRGGERNGLQPILSDELSDQLNMFFPFIGMPPITSENPLYATYNSKSELQYIEVPALVKFGWGDNFRFSVAVGPYVSVLIKANQVTEGTSQFFLNSDGTNPVFVPGPDGLPPYTELPPTSVGASTDIKDDLKTVNFGGTFAVGISKKLNESSELFFDARASYGFNTIQINDQYGESSIGGVIFSLGYAHKIQ
tara:strand:+ start:994 stop:1848 length:855 start_codon:yes stop_codon:yes gene_type:complete